MTQKDLVTGLRVWRSTARGFGAEAAQYAIQQPLDERQRMGSVSAFYYQLARYTSWLIQELEVEGVQPSAPTVEALKGWWGICEGLLTPCTTGKNWLWHQIPASGRCQAPQPPIWDELISGQESERTLRLENWLRNRAKELEETAPEIERIMEGFKTVVFRAAPLFGP